MNATHAVAAAIIFTWLGMVIAISFIEAPLKFRAPGVTLPIPRSEARSGPRSGRRPRVQRRNVSSSWCASMSVFRRG